MICLMFLISLAVVEYVAGRAKDARLGEKEPPAPAESCASGLLTLGNALDQYGRGQAPGPGADVSGREKTCESPANRR